ncbi:MAG: ATP-binding cassette domain-containing protein [Bacteroidales bacterium]|nr:ATP-binding cassette domain-containing protein [Bacteroidales bacterium]
MVEQTPSFEPGNLSPEIARFALGELHPGENVAVIGDNAAGKSRLVEKFLVHCPYDKVQYIAFRDTYGISNSSYYLQKRWNQIEIDPEFNPTVRQSLERTLGEPIADSSDESLLRLLSFFHLTPLLDEYLISLSSGELRRFHLAKALLRHPQILVIDNPFIGLDAATREMLSALLDELAGRGIQLVLVMARLDVVPKCVTHYVIVDGEKSERLPREVASGFQIPRERTSGFPRDEKPVDWSALEARVEAFPVKDLSQESFYPQQPGAEIIRCNAVTIRYGSRIILKDLDWVVHEGEKWVVSGANGSGKSTLLSCVCADNPQSYACDIELFSHRRGSGETIWDIKRHIGYVSPEMHRAYQKNIPAENVVASGLFDTVGLFQRATPEQMALCHEWMEVFGIRDLAERSFLKLSSGEQRLCLLARAFVKDPELLILDEPFHGLDAHRSEMAKHIIEAFVRRPHKTLILISHFPSEYPPCITHELRLQK